MYHIGGLHPGLGKGPRVGLRQVAGRPGGGQVITTLERVGEDQEQEIVTKLSRVHNGLMR